MSTLTVQDLRIECFDRLVNCPDRYTWRITHEPTGTSAEATGEHYIPTRERALADLRAALEAGSGT